MLLLGHQRTEINGWIEAMTDLQLTGLRHDSFDDAIVNGLVSEQTRSRRAALTLIVEDGVGCAGNGEFQIGIRKDDGGRLAAQFERDAFEVSGGGLNDQFAYFGRAGESDLVHV